MAVGMPLFILYGTVGCHLCELAEAQLAALLERLQLAAGSVEIECIDISDSDELLMRYGERIPVLQRLTDSAEIAWPFEDSALCAFLQY
jgi:hypothetical protein